MAYSACLTAHFRVPLSLHDREPCVTWFFPSLIRRLRRCIDRWIYPGSCTNVLGTSAAATFLQKDDGLAVLASHTHDTILFHGRRCAGAQQARPLPLSQAVQPQPPRDDSGRRQGCCDTPLPGGASRARASIPPGPISVDRFSECKSARSDEGGRSVVCACPPGCTGTHGTALLSFVHLRRPAPLRPFCALSAVSHSLAHCALQEASLYA